MMVKGFYSSLNSIWRKFVINFGKSKFALISAHFDGCTVIEVPEPNITAYTFYM